VGAEDGLGSFFRRCPNELAHRLVDQLSCRRETRLELIGDAKLKPLRRYHRHHLRTDNRTDVSNGGQASVDTPDRAAEVKGTHRPWNSGSRFSRDAARPSAASAVAMHTVWRSRSYRTASSIGITYAARRFVFAACAAIGALVAIRAANAATVLWSASAG